MRTKQSKANREARAAGKARQVRSSALGKLLIMLAVVAAIVFGVAIFFKVNTIEIQGNTVYSADQIIEASQIQQGDNLLTVNKALAVGNIKAALPYPAARIDYLPYMYWRTAAEREQSPQNISPAANIHNQGCIWVKTDTAYLYECDLVLFRSFLNNIVKISVSVLL